MHQDDNTHVTLFGKAIHDFFTSPLNFREWENVPLQTGMFHEILSHYGQVQARLYQNDLANKIADLSASNGYTRLF